MENTMEKTNQNTFIDIVKGIAIFLMLWGHCIQCCYTGSGLDFYENGMFRFIYTFHMPLFMLVSGYLFFSSFSKRDLKELLVHRVQGLLQPIIFGSFFCFLVTTSFFYALRGQFDTLFSGNWMTNLTSLWFLWSVLAATVATAIVCKKATRLPVQIFLLFAMIPVVGFFPNIDLNLYMYPYFVLGFYFAKYKDQLPAFVHNAKYLSLPLFPVLLHFFEKKHYIYTTGLLPSDTYSLPQMLMIDAYRWIIGLVGSIFMVTVLQLLYQHITVKTKNPVLSTGLSKIGQKSLQIYVFSMAFLSEYLTVFFPKILSALNIPNIFTANMFLYNFVFTFGLSIIYSFGLYYLTILFEKLKLSRILFGK